MDPDHLAVSMSSISTKDEGTVNDEDESDILMEIIEEVQDFEEFYLVCCEAVKQVRLWAGLVCRAPLIIQLEYHIVKELHMLARNVGKIFAF